MKYKNLYKNSKFEILNSKQISIIQYFNFPNSLNCWNLKIKYCLEFRIAVLEFSLRCKEVI